MPSIWPSAATTLGCMYTSADRMRAVTSSWDRVPPARRRLPARTPRCDDAGSPRRDRPPRGRSGRGTLAARGAGSPPRGALTLVLLQAAHAEHSQRAASRSSHVLAVVLRDVHAAPHDRRPVPQFRVDLVDQEVPVELGDGDDRRGGAQLVRQHGGAREDVVRVDRHAVGRADQLVDHPAGGRSRSAHAAVAGDQVGRPQPGGHSSAGAAAHARVIAAVGRNPRGPLPTGAGRPGGPSRGLEHWPGAHRGSTGSTRARDSHGTAAGCTTFEDPVSNGKREMCQPRSSRASISRRMKVSESFGKRGTT